MSKHARQLMGMVVLMILAVGLAACSGSNPVNSNQALSSRSGSDSSTHEVEFAGRTATTDSDTRTLAFSDNAEIAVAAMDAEIVRKANGLETPIAFSEIMAGDSVEVRGTRQPDNTVLADRIRVRPNDDEDEDVEFEGVITSINLDSSFLTVSGRNEMVFVDGNTMVFARMEAVGASAAHDGEDDDNSGRGRTGSDTALNLSDLTVRDSVEIHALILDSLRLLATRIEVEDGFFGEDANQVEFKDELASVNVTNRIVTFATENWIGAVAEEADLRNPLDNMITLDEFMENQLVEVKGFVVSGDTITVVRMHMDNSP